MLRRRFFSALAGGLCAAPESLAQRPPRSMHMGFLSGNATSQFFIIEPTIRRAFSDLGYVEGQNLTLNLRFADTQLGRLPALAAELVGRQVDVMLTSATAAAIAARGATSTIPIVAVAMGDPVADGLVKSLNSPGGNVTGNTFLGPDIFNKRFTLLGELLPSLKNVTTIVQRGSFTDHTLASFLREADVAAKERGIALRQVSVASISELDSELRTARAERPDALIVFPSPLFYAAYRRVADMIAEVRVPAIYYAREFVTAGGLISYGANIPDLFRRGVTMADRIIRGARPADLPVEQPTRFEMLINLRTAQSLGLIVPPPLLARADEVIE